MTEMSETERQLENDPIHSYLVRARNLYEQEEVSNGFIAPVASLRKDGIDSEIKNVIPFLDSELSTPNSLVLLLGDYGSGKTSVAMSYGMHLAEKALTSYPDCVVPIFLRLSHARNSSIPEAIANFLSRYNGVSPSIGTVQKKINNAERLVLILDGLDEMVDSVDYTRLREAVSKIEEVRARQNVSILLTCRSTFFRVSVEQSIVNPTSVLTLLPFDLEMQRKYVGFRDPRGRIWPKIYALFESDPSLQEMCGSPIHLFLLVQILRNEQSQLLAPVSKVDLYRKFFEYNIAINLRRFLPWPPDKHKAFLMELAYRWFKDDILESPISDFRNAVAAWDPEAENDQIEEYAAQIWNCSLFTRIDDNFRFLHRSLLEFLVAESAVEQLKAGRLRAWDHPFYTEIFDFLYWMLEDEGSVPELIAEVFKQPRAIAQGNILAAVYRHTFAGLEPVFETQLANSPFPIVRQVAAQGWGAYFPSSAEQIYRLAKSCSQQDNSITRMTMRQICKRWIRNLNDPDVSCELPDLYYSEADANAILSRETLGDGLIKTYRRALDQPDDRWTSIIGAIYLLSAIGDVDSNEVMIRVVQNSDVAEIKEAYEHTKIALTRSNTKPVFGKQEPNLEVIRNQLIRCNASEFDSFIAELTILELKLDKKSKFNKNHILSDTRPKSVANLLQRFEANFENHQGIILLAEAAERVFPFIDFWAKTNNP